MDTTQVFMLMARIVELSEQNAKLVAQTSEVGGMNFTGLEIILALIGFLGGIWGVLELYQKLRSVKDLSKIESESSFNKKVLEKEAEENRVFQQTMVESTQKSYITLVDSLMNFQQTFLLDLNKNIIALTQQVQRAGSIAESVNRRMITFDKQSQSNFSQISAKLDNQISSLRDIQSSASISLKELFSDTKDQEGIDSKDKKDTTDKLLEQLT